MDKPYYPLPGIGSVEALAKALDVHPDLLRDISKKADTSYTSFAIPKKSDPASTRSVCEPKHELKRLQKKINSRILEKVNYPAYLHGGIKDDSNVRDYVKNSALHTKPKVLVAVDIKNFYPNIKSEQVFSVFKNFFAFEPEVAEVLTALTTLNGRIPQGGCCSSYLANLIFFDDEYKLVQRLRKKGWRYSRLLDDITISSEKHIDDHITPIKEIAALCRKYDLKLNNKKTDVKHRKHGIAQLAVTGVWIGHGLPKIKRDERRYIRQLVYICEQKYKVDPYSKSYHDFWNQASGKVAKLTRMEHPESKRYRKRMQQILPLFDAHQRNSVIKEIKTLCSKSSLLGQRIGFIRRVNRAHYSLNILSRTDVGLVKSLRKELQDKHSNLPTMKEYWS